MSIPYSSASRFAVYAVKPGSQGRVPRTGSGERNGASVSTNTLSIGTNRADSRTSGAFLYVTTPVKLRFAP